MKGNPNMDNDIISNLRHCDAHYDHIEHDTFENAIEAIEQLIGQEKFEELFLTTTVQSLETGKAAKVLKVADPAFLKGGTQ